MFLCYAVDMKRQILLEDIYHNYTLSCLAGKSKLYWFDSTKSQLI